MSQPFLILRNIVASSRTDGQKIIVSGAEGRATFEIDQGSLWLRNAPPIAVYMTVPMRAMWVSALKAERHVADLPRTQFRLIPVPVT
jgi:hypothetical protein